MFEVSIRVDSLEDAQALMRLVIHSPQYDAVLRLHLAQIETGQAQDPETNNPAA